MRRISRNVALLACVLFWRVAPIDADRAQCIQRIRELCPNGDCGGDDAGYACFGCGPDAGALCSVMSANCGSVNYCQYGMYSSPSCVEDEEDGWGGGFGCVQPPPQCGHYLDYCGNPYDLPCCESENQSCQDGLCLNNYSPILINLESSANYDLTSAAAGATFDMDGDGRAEQVGWTSTDDAVGFLALDRNHNGVIDNGRELFGNATLKPDGKSHYSNGFDALDELDAGAARNGQIDSSDFEYKNLRLWFDRNHNGLSEASELVPLPDAHISRILTSYQEQSRRDRFGNSYRYRGTAFVVVKGHEQRRLIFDVFPAHEP